MDAACAEILVQVHDDLGIAARAERVAALLELRAKLLVVIDFAVQDDDDRPVFVEKRLISRFEVDNPQPLNSEADTVVDENAARIGAAMFDRRAHPLE